MDFTRRTAQLLHEDHRETIGQIEQLEDLISRSGRNMPDTSNPATRKALQNSAEMIERELRGHFAFEENELFTRLEESGDVGIAEHLREEHAAILPLGDEVGKIAAAALENGFDADSWAAFKTGTGELIERMLSHIQKEEMALLPMLEDLLDAEQDLELSEAFSESQL